jgi:hypothetical protein
MVCLKHNRSSHYNDVYTEFVLEAPINDFISNQYFTYGQIDQSEKQSHILLVYLCLLF